MNKILRNIKSIGIIAGQDIRAWGQNFRMIMLLMILCIVLGKRCIEIAEFAVSINSPVNVIGLLPLLYSQARFFNPLIIQLGIVLMFSNAPFKGGNSQFTVMRTGYGKWCAGKILYIFTASGIFTISLFALTNIFSLVSAAYSPKWGKTLNTLMASRSGLGIWIPERVGLQYAPLEALLHNMLLIFLLSVFLGLLTFFFSSVVGRSSGVIASAAVVLLGMFPYYAENIPKAVKISPCSLTNLNYITKENGISFYPGLSYSYAVLSGLVILFTAANIFVYSNKKIRHYIYAAEV